jgi:hypothetical protein
MADPNSLPASPASLPPPGEASPAEPTTQGANGAVEAAPAPEAPQPAAPAVPPMGGQKPQANGNGHVEDGTAFAVLTAPRGNLRASQVVFGPAAAIAAVIAAGEARPASDAELEISNPFHYPLPEA